MRDPAVRAEFGGNIDVLGAHLRSLRRETAKVSPPVLSPTPVVAQPSPRAPTTAAAPTAPVVPPVAKPLVAQPAHRATVGSNPTSPPSAAVPDGPPFVPAHGDRSTVAAILRHLGLTGTPLRGALRTKGIAPTSENGVPTFRNTLRAHVRDPATARRFEDHLDLVIFDTAPVSI